MAVPTLRCMLIVLGNVTVVVMVMALALSGERRWRQRKSCGNNYEQTKIAKHLEAPQVGFPEEGYIWLLVMWDRKRGPARRADPTGRVRPLPCGLAELSSLAARLLAREVKVIPPWMIGRPRGGARLAV
jgi:hypothetical protein